MTTWTVGISKPLWVRNTQKTKSKQCDHSLPALYYLQQCVCFYAATTLGRIDRWFWYKNNFFLNGKHEDHHSWKNVTALQSFLPGSHVCRNQDFIDAGLKLGEVCKSLFLEKIKSSRSFFLQTHSSGLIRSNPLQWRFYINTRDLNSLHVYVFVPLIR